MSILSGGPCEWDPVLWLFTGDLDNPRPALAVPLAGMSYTDASHHKREDLPERG